MTDILNDKKICGCLNKSMCSACIFSTSTWTSACVGVTFGEGRCWGYAMLAFGVFVYKACEMEEVRLCGGR